MHYIYILISLFRFLSCNLNWYFLLFFGVDMLKLLLSFELQSFMFFLMRVIVATQESLFYAVPSGAMETYRASIESHLAQCEVNIYFGFSSCSF